MVEKRVTKLLEIARLLLIQQLDNIFMTQYNNSIEIPRMNI